MTRRALAAVLALFLTPSATPAQVDLAGLEAELGLRASTLVQVLLEGTPGGSARAQLIVEGAPLPLELHACPVLGPGFQLLEQKAGGELRAVPFRQPATYRGTSPALGGVSVAASWLGDGLHARLRTASGEDYWIEPIPARHGGGFGDHLLFAGTDAVGAVGRGGTCGLEDPPLGASPGLPGGGSVGGSGISPGPQVAELACDADFEFFLAHGSSSTEVLDRIALVVNTMNLQYESQVDLTHELTGIVVRTSPDDPYESTNANALLDEFRAEWEANQEGVPRDVAQLFTGKDLDGSTLGLAWQGTVCGTLAYGLVQSDYGGNLACSTDLSAHELGHGWGAVHCLCNSTMNSFITCANSFGSEAIAAIKSYTSAVGCLSAEPGLTTAGSDELQ